MKRCLVILLAIAVVFSSLTFVFADDSVITISTADELKAVASSLGAQGGAGKIYQLGADINLEGAIWNTYAIGSAAVPFQGTFDGAGHKILNYKLNVPTGDYKEADGRELDLGLFGVLGGDAVVKNLGLDYVSFQSDASWGYNARGGALAAKLVDNAKVDRCYARNVTFNTEEKSKLGEAGGLIGYLNGTGVAVTNSYSVAFLEENDSCAHEASLVGLGMQFSKIENCYAEGSLASVVSEKTSAIINSYSTDNSGWSANTRVGTLVTADRLKGMHKTLGSAFKIGTNYNSGFPVLTWEPDADAMKGAGTEADPYRIKSKEDLIEVSIMETTEGKYFQLDADIDLYNVQWKTPIGTPSNVFRGVFDGGGHVIRNYWYYVPVGDISAERIGLFGVVGGDAVIKDLGVEQVRATSNESWGYNAVVGGMISELKDNAAVESCYVRNIVADTKNVNVGVLGGMVGLVSGAGATVKNCYCLEFTEIDDCVSTEDGLIGKIDNVLAVENCYSASTFATVKSDIANRVKNCYTISKQGWAPGGYQRAGESITASKLKAAVYKLGAGFKEGGEETLGFPALLWQNVTTIVYDSFDTDVPLDKENFVYECEFNYKTDEKISFYFENTSGSYANELVTLDQGVFYIASNEIKDVEAPAGKYKICILRDATHKNTNITITSPDGSVLRRGDALFTDGMDDVRRVVIRAYGENDVERHEIVAYPQYVSKPFALIAEPALTGFDANVYNLVTSTDTDPKTTRTFAWTSVESFDNMEVMYKAEGDAAWKTEPAIAENVLDEYYQGVHYFKADLKGLTPGTKYIYKIGKTGSDSVNDWSREYHFETEAENTDEFKFIALSDTQGTVWDGDVKYTHATLHAAKNDVPDAAFLLNAGDLIQDATNDVNSWNMYLKSLKGVCETLPHYAAIGNHDIWKHIEGNEHLGMGENVLFDLHLNHPNNGGTAAVDITKDDLAPSNIGIPILFQQQNFDETIYSFNYGNAHFVVLNSGGSWGMDTDDVVLLNGQKRWLKDDLEANKDARWKIVVMHRPVYASSKPVYDNLVFGDVFQKYGVDLVIHGDEHWTARSYQIDNEAIVASSMQNVDLVSKGKGTVYTLIGSVKTFGNSHVTYNGTFHREMFMGNGTEDKLPVYATFEITDEKIEVTHKQIDGMVVDNFTIIADDAAAQVVRVSQFGVAVKELLQLTPGYKAKAETNGDAEILVGYYDETGRLVYAQNADENHEFVVYDGDFAELRLFALESIGSMKPLSKAYELK